MNREIKFRAWDMRTQKFIAVGFHVFGEVTMFSIIDQYLFQNKLVNEPTLLRYNHLRVTEFTGCKDIKGKDIYEGDIVKEKYLNFTCDEYGNDIDEWTDRIGVIEYRGRGFWVTEEDFGWEGENMWGWNQLEIIGNIYENPELIPKKDELPDSNG